MKKKIHLLIIDDEKEIVMALKEYLEEYDVSVFTESLKALEMLKKKFFDIVIVDFKMPSLNGLELLVEAKKHKCYNEAILLTAYADKSLLEEALNQSLVCKVLDKPLRLSVLKENVDKIAWDIKKNYADQKAQTLEKTRYEILREELESSYHKVIGQDKGLGEVFKKIEFIKDVPVSVCITGETGTGKEVIAHAIHNASSRKDGPFIKVNCAAVPENLFESELFGVAKGAYTGAHKDRPGKIELASGGTLFLDEIGEMKLDIQAKLLRVIQTRDIERIGDASSRSVDFRLITATNRNLEKEVEKKKFRMDLFYRINEFPIHLPSLRERLDDIDDFIYFFIGRFSEEMGLTFRPEITKDTISLLKQYHWPGNVRELENALKRVVIMLQGKAAINPEHIDFLFCTSTMKEKQYSHNSIVKYLASNMIDKKINFKKLEKEVLRTIVEISGNSVATAVKKTGIDRNKFYRSLPAGRA